MRGPKKQSIVVRKPDGELEIKVEELKLIKDKYPDKELLSTPMKQEVDRCELCVRKAREGCKVVLICSGDAGVYGMASLMIQVADRMSFEDVTVVPGITAALSGGAVLGAPLGHDFCVISLSDLLTPWELIEKRLRNAAMGDFAIAIYNPSSMKRSDYLRKACEIMEPYIEKDRVCGYVNNIGREGENFKIVTFEELKSQEVSMFTTVFIGNSQTLNLNGRMVTPRGYRNADT